MTISSKPTSRPAVLFVVQLPPCPVNRCFYRFTIIHPLAG